MLNLTAIWVASYENLILLQGNNKGADQPAHSCSLSSAFYIFVQSLRSTVKQPVLSSHSKRSPNIGFQYQLSLNAGQKYCRMLQGEHSAILLSFIKLPFSIKTCLAIFKWPLKTGFTENVLDTKFYYSS